MTALFLAQHPSTTMMLLEGIFLGPVLRDDEDGSLWAGLGLQYNDLMVVDADGTVILDIDYVTFPDDADEIIQAVEAAL